MYRSSNMRKSSRISPNAAGVTRSYPFSQIGSGIEVFAVQQGVPVESALEQASMLLDACLASANGAAEIAQGVDEECRVYSAIFMLQSVRALVNAALEGMGEQGQ
jgi:hypothetical protein